MSDTPPNDPDGTTGPRWALVIISVLVVVGAAIAAFAFFGGDDDDETVATTEPTVAATTTPVSTEAPTTDAPEPTTPPPTDAPATTDAPTTTAAPSTLEFTIDDIDDGATIPIEFTCDGDNTPPLVTIESSPEGTLQLAFIVDDPDAPTDDPFVHWVVYGIAGNATQFTDAEEGLVYGANDAGVEGWIGPCPPDGEHEYVFTLFALDQVFELEPGLDGRELADTIEPAIIAETMITATYTRAG